MSTKPSIAVTYMPFSLGDQDGWGVPRKNSRSGRRQNGGQSMQLVDNGVELEDGDNFIVRTKEGHSLFLVFERGRLTISNEKALPAQVIEANDDGYEWIDDQGGEDMAEGGEPGEFEAFKECAARCGTPLSVSVDGVIGGTHTALGNMCLDCAKAFDGYTKAVMLVLTSTRRARMPMPPGRLSKLICPGGLTYSHD